MYVAFVRQDVTKTGHTQLRHIHGCYLLRAMFNQFCKYNYREVFFSKSQYRYVIKCNHSINTLKTVITKANFIRLKSALAVK